MTDLQEHIKMGIYKIYFTQKVCEQIKELRQQRINDIISYMNLDGPLSADKLALISELTDIGDFLQLGNAHHPINGLNYTGIFSSIAYALDRFYANTLPVQQQHIINANNFECRTNRGNTKHYRNFEYFEELYSKYIDYYGNHSGSSFGYCCSNITGFIMGSKTYKLELWAKFIKNYILT